MKPSIRYVTPDGVEPPTAAAPAERKVRDWLMSEDIRVPVAVNRLEQYVKSMGPGPIDISQAIMLAQARFNLLPDEIREVVTETAYAILLKTAKNKGKTRATAIGAPFDNAKRDTLLAWLTGKFEELSGEDLRAIVVTEMGDYDAQ